MFSEIKIIGSTMNPLERELEGEIFKVDYLYTFLCESVELTF